VRGNAFRASTDPSTQFTDALVTGASETENLRLPGAIGGSGSCRSILRHLIVASVEQLAWEIVLFSRRSFASAPIGSSTFLAGFQFAAGNSKQYGGGGGLECHHRHRRRTNRGDRHRRQRRHGGLAGDIQ